MAHAILPGAAIGYLIAGLSLPAMTIGGVVAGFAVAVGSGAIARATVLREDASLAAFYLLSLALGVTIVSVRGSNVDLMHVLFGSVLALDNATLILLASIASVTLVRTGRDLSAAGAGDARSRFSRLGQRRRRLDPHRLSSAWSHSISSPDFTRWARCWRSVR